VRLAPLPEARTEVSVASDGERIYLVGGFAPSVRKRVSAPQTLYAYEPIADAWYALGEIPQGVNHAGLAVLEGKLYVMGGYRGTSFKPTGAVQIYNFATGQWRRGAPMPTPRGALAVVAANGLIHTIGGTVVGGGSVAVHEVYDPAGDRWRARASMPTPRNHHGAAVAAGLIVVPGGRVGGDFELTVNEIYDPAKDTWRRGAPMPTGRSGIAVTALAGMVYVFGGETRRRTFAEAERYDTTADRWQVLPEMPTARHGLGAGTLGAAINVIAGGPAPGFAFSDANERLTPADLH
jgi:N-acetylneuraminic acid mutarotase